MVTLSLRLRPSLRVSLTCMWVLPVFILFGQVLVVVRARGVEPPRLAALEPKSSASASSATPAEGPAGRVGARVYRKISGQSKPHWQATDTAGGKRRSTYCASRPFFVQPLPRRASGNAHHPTTSV